MLFSEARKKKDLYIWLAKVPEGPSVKFHVTNGEPLVQCALLNALSTPLCWRLICISSGACICKKLPSA